MMAFGGNYIRGMPGKKGKNVKDKGRNKGQIEARTKIYVNRAKINDIRCRKVDTGKIISILFAYAFTV
jgi:hypothetical protein